MASNFGLGIMNESQRTVTLNEGRLEWQSSNSPSRNHKTNKARENNDKNKYKNKRHAQCMISFLRLASSYQIKWKYMVSEHADLQIFTLVNHLDRHGMGHIAT
jgi:hypothetical protein